MNNTPRTTARQVAPWLGQLPGACLARQAFAFVRRTSRLGKVAKPGVGGTDVMPGAKGSAKQFKPMSMRWLACVDKVIMRPLTKTAGVHGLFSTIDLSLVSATSGRSVTVPKTATIWADAVCIWIPALVQPAAIGNGDLNGNDGTDAGKATNCRVAIDVISREKN